MLLILTVLIFLVSLALVLSGVYFFMEVPRAKKRLQQRLSALQQVYTAGPMDIEAELLRQELFSQIPFLNRLLVRLSFARYLRRFLDQAGVKWSVAMVLLISITGFLVTLAAFSIFNFPWYLALAPSLLAAGVPFLIIVLIRARRFSRFLESLPDALDLLGRAVRAGHAFTTALELIANEMPQPIADEFRIVYDQQNFGLPLRDALQNLTVRVPLQDVRIFVMALQIQRESGGNLAEILDNLSYVIRERFKLQRQIKVFTAEGRASLLVLTIVPPCLAVAFMFLNPEYIKPLFVDPLGQQMLAAGIVMQIIGYLVIRKITRMKV